MFGRFRIDSEYWLLFRRYVPDVYWGFLTPQAADQ